MPVALLSVYNKTGIVELAGGLRELDFSLLASGGTAKAIREAGDDVQDVAGLVGGGPILGHRVVTLSREVHAGLLARPEDQAELANLGIPSIDLVVVNLYPLGEALAAENRTVVSVLEMTDIGGPAMLMAGLKGRRLVVCDPSDYPRIVPVLRRGKTEEVEELRLELMATAAHLVSRYYGQLAGYLSEILRLERPLDQLDGLGF